MSYFEKYVTYKKETILIVSVLATAAVVVTLASLFTTTRGSLQTTCDTFISQKTATFISQKTATSKAGTLPIHQTHQVVTVLPPRTDGKVWIGTITWASSKPIEVEMWHFYNSSLVAVAAHGMPVLTPYGNKSIAFTLLKPSSGTPLPSGTLNFTASELSFHTLDGSKFTVTYTVNAAAKKPNQ